MSVIAHWIEQQGIHTVVIGLVNLHLQKIKPPRALWVPFELGRPLGAPGDPEFQREVLSTALGMIETPATESVIIEFDKEETRGQPDPHWQAPQIKKATTVLAEVQELRTLYQQHCVGRSRTSVGVSKLTIDEAAALVDSLGANGLSESPDKDISPVLMSRLAIDDLKSYYLEAGLAKGKPGSLQLHHWLWNHTEFGRHLLELRSVWMQSDDKKLARLGNMFLVPHRFRDIKKQ